jgi:hypothetical protein
LPMLFVPTKISLILSIWTSIFFLNNHIPT